MSELSEESVVRRSLKPQESLEESLIREELSALLHDELMCLTELQRERVELLLEGKTFVEIAEREGCKYQSVQESVAAIRKKFKKFL